MSRTFRPSTLSTVLAAAALALAAAPASAATWSKTSSAAGSTCEAIQNNAVANSIDNNPYDGAPSSCVLGKPANNQAGATVSAWGNTGAGGSWAAAQVTNQGLGGFGVKNAAPSADDANEGTSPEHALDNHQRTDAILYSFGGKVALTELVTGWSSNDQDITVLRFTGAGAPVMGNYNLTNGATPGTNMLSNGWSLMGNYAYAPDSSGVFGVDTKTTINLNNTTSLASSYWLVMAYSTAFGNTIKGRSSNTEGLTGNNDYFKLLSVSGTTTVAEPGVLALAGLGLFGVAWSRRAKKQAA